MKLGRNRGDDDDVEEFILGIGEDFSDCLDRVAQERLTEWRIRIQSKLGLTTTRVIGCSPHVQDISASVGKNDHFKKPLFFTQMARENHFRTRLSP